MALPNKQHIAQIKVISRRSADLAIAFSKLPPGASQQSRAVEF
jgi:hypothetical protein